VSFYCNMTLKEIAWGQFLSSDPPLPPDVTFRMIEGEVVVGELKAHKYFLASVSSVFRKQFFGKLAERRKIIDIKETTYDAFKFLLNYIYNGSDVWMNEEAGNLEEMFEIINLAEKYDIKTLREEIPKHLDNYDIEENNVLEVSRTAEVFKHFESVSTQLLTKCSDFLKLVLKTDDDIANFCNSFVKYPEDQRLVVDLLNMNNVKYEEIFDLDVMVVDECGQAEGKPLPVFARMCLKNVNWLEFLTLDSEIPQDVTFEIMELPKYSAVNGIGDKIVVGEIKAHKYLLATISEVFKDQFFGDTNTEDNDIIGETSDAKVEIIGPSFNAFKVMIDYIYGKYPTLRGADQICEIFEIINLAERFQISGLEEEYRTAMFLYFRER